MTDDWADAQRRLTELESALAGGKPEASAAAAVALLQHVRTRLSRATRGVPSRDDWQAWCVRFAVAWSELVTLHSWDQQGDAALPPLLGELSTLYALVACTPEGHLDAALSAQVERFRTQRQAIDFLRMLLLWTPDSVVWSGPFANFETARPVVTAMALASIAAMAACSERAGAARNAALALLGSGRVAASDLLPFVPQAVFSSAWFRCSYADAVDKHRAKIPMNMAAAQVLEALERGAPEPAEVPLPPPDGRPRMVLPLEWAFRSDGAMYRCYAAVLRELRSEFQTLGLGSRDAVDASTVALFDGFATYEDLCRGGLPDPGTVARAIRRLQPDLLFYPSVGMMQLTILLASTRLAPRQAMSVGHPASSMSAAMDAVVTEAAYVGDAAIFSERALLLPPGAMVFEAPARRTGSGSRNGPDADGSMQVAIPAVGHKIGWPLLSLLREVQERLTRPCVFHFFTGLPGTGFHEIDLQVRRVLPAARVYPLLDYARYVAAIDRCHLHVASFPFGGTNSVIDSLVQGVPVAALEGREVHERVDAALLRQVGLQELVATDRAGYRDLLVELLSDPGRLLALRRRILHEGRVARELMEGGRPREFARALAGLQVRTQDERG